MKKLTTALIAAVLALALVLPTLAEEGNGGTLVVTGTATVSLQADTATLEIGAMTRGHSVADAQKENTAIMKKLVAEMERLGVAKEDIRTIQFYVYYEQGDSVVGTTSRLISGSYTVTNMVSITIRDIAKASEVIDAAASVGANNIYGLTFQSSKAAEAYHQALRRAVEDAKAKAQVLAEASGKTLGGATKVETKEAFDAPYGIMNRDSFAGTGSAASTPILSGDVSVTANVTMTFGLE